MRTEDVISIVDIDDLCNESAEYLVDGFILEKSVNFACGDSGLGKSPLFYQLALAVATGTPWLGHKTKKGKVLFLDYENGLPQIKELRDRLCGHMGIDPPRDLYVFTGHDEFTENILQEIQPTLIIADPLRLFDPRVETDNATAGKIFGDLKEAAKKYNAAFQVIHHIRKFDAKNMPTPLKDAGVLDWLQQASGPRAFVNHSDVRLGIDHLHNGEPKEAALILKKFQRGIGESAPIYLSRTLDAGGDPLGYQRMSGIDLLLTRSQQEKYLLLPTQFTFSDARKLIGGNSDSTADRFLKNCLASGLVEKRLSIYSKVDLGVG